MQAIISFLNKKGGVAKTTTTLECAYQLGWHHKKKVLVVDLDSQASATKMLCITKPEKSIADLLLDTSDCSLKDVVIPARNVWANTAIIPSSLGLVKAETILQTYMQRETLLKRALCQAHEIFDFILFDLPPGMNLYVVNALVASTHYIIPTEVNGASAIDGVRSIEALASSIRDTGLNPTLESLGVLVTQYQKGNSLSVRGFLSELNKEYPLNPLKELRVPHSSKVGESQREKVPLGAFIPQNPVSQIYRNLSTIIQEALK